MTTLKRKVGKSVIILTLASSILLGVAGCGAEQNSKVATPSEVEASTEKNNEQTSSIIGMVYNFPKDGKFKLSFNTAKILPTDTVEIFSDVSCNKESLEKYTSYSEYNSSDSQELYIESLDINGWSAGIKYIKLNYDLDSQEIRKLEHPIVIPFKVNNNIEIPNLSIDIDSTGVLKLVWDDVDNAEGYNVYKKGSDGEIKLVAELDGEAREFNDWEVNGTNGISESNNVIISQNTGLNLDEVYWIKSIVNGELSDDSNIIKIADYADELPIKIIGDYKLGIGESVKSTKDLPRTTNIQTLSGEVLKYSVNFKLDESTRFDSKIYYNYNIVGTRLKGYVEVDPEFVTYMPSSIRNGVEIYSDSEDIRFNVSHSKEEIGDSKEFNLTDYIKGHLVNTDVSAIEYLTNKLKNLESDIDLSGYGELQNSDELRNILNELVYKTNLLAGVISFRFYEDTSNLHVVYKYTNKELELYSDMLSGTLDFIVDEMNLSGTDLEKEDAIYKYINDNYKYDAKSDIFEMVLGENHSGNAVAYSRLFKELCDRAGIKSDIIAGRLRGKKHVWNKVYIDDYVGYVDCTNNVKNTGLIKICYNMNPDYAKSIGYVASKGYITDTEENVNDNSIEYYTMNNLVASNLKEYTDILNRELDNGKNIITVRYVGEEVPSNYIINGISKLFKDRNEEIRLKDLKFGDGLGYYVIWFEEQK